MNKKLDKLISSYQNIFLGEATQLGNINEKISVKILNNTFVEAIALNEINSTGVAVFYDRGNYYCLSSTSPQVILKTLEASRILPFFTEEEINEELPFQVLHRSNENNNSVYVGGDRSSLLLQEIAFNLGGITNTGEQNFLTSVYNENSCNITKFNSTPENVSISSFAVCPTPTQPEWFGFGKFGLDYILFPEENLIVNQTGLSLPFDVLDKTNYSYQTWETNDYEPPLGYYVSPLYPIFSERSDAARIGGKSIFQNEENENFSYNFSIMENWKYRHLRYGNAPDPTPSIFNVSAICIGLNTGSSFQVDFFRETEAEYNRNTSFQIEHTREFWLNEKVFKGNREHIYTEEYIYDQSPVLFASGTSFICNANPLFPGAPGFYEPSFSSALWDGETTTETRNYYQKINEPDWEYPINTEQVRFKKDIQETKYILSSNYQLENESWFLGSIFPSTFSFKVDGSEIQNATFEEDIDKITPKLLIIGTNGLESIFTENVILKKIIYSSYRERDIPKLISNYSTEVPFVVFHEQNETFSNKDSIELYYYDGTNLIALSLQDSFCFEIESDLIFSIESLGAFTFSNENDEDDNEVPIVSQPIEIINGYIKNSLQENNGEVIVNYTEIQKKENPLFKDFIGREIYLLANGFRGSGTISNYNFTDTVNQSLEIETNRKINSITLEITKIEKYPLGLNESGKVLIYPSNNAASLVEKKLLSSENKKYCNLVNGRIYFAKSLKYDLTNNQQTAEVYEIFENRIIQGSPEIGSFIPINNSSQEQVESAAYYPI